MCDPSVAENCGINSRGGQTGQQSNEHLDSVSSLPFGSFIEINQILERR